MTVTCPQCGECIEAEADCEHALAAAIDDLSRERHDHAATIDALAGAKRDLTELGARLSREQTQAHADRLERDEANAMRRLAEHERDCLRRALDRERRRVKQLRRAVLAWSSYRAADSEMNTYAWLAICRRASDRSRDDA